MTALNPADRSVSSVRPQGAASGRSGRLVSVDVFRGLMVAGMILVTNAGSWDFVYWPLKHAEWNGVTPTDMIFPSFLLIVGVSMSLSFAARFRRGESRMHLLVHVVERGVLLILLGLFLNGFPLFDWHDLRIPGVLQRIGLCYLIAGLVYLATVRQRRADGGVRFRMNAGAMIAVMVVLLAGYWSLMKLVPVPGYGVGRLDAAGNLGAYIDRSLMGTNHLWFWGGQQWDPEGLLSTLPATVNLMLGILAGEWIRGIRNHRKRLLWIVVVGAVLVIAGVALNPLIPINKKIWTDSFVLFSGGVSLLALALLHWLIDLRGWRRGLTPALIFGTNAVLGFALANMINPIFGLVGRHDASGKLTPVNGLAFEILSRFLDPWNASLGYALAFVLLTMVILWPLYRRGIFVRL
jgi:predicted acyltransferase